MMSFPSLTPSVVFLELLMTHSLFLIGLSQKSLWHIGLHFLLYHDVFLGFMTILYVVFMFLRSWRQHMESFVMAFWMQ